MLWIEKNKCRLIVVTEIVKDLTASAVSLFGNNLYGNHNSLAQYMKLEASEIVVDEVCDQRNSSVHTQI